MIGVSSERNVIRETTQQIRSMNSSGSVMLGPVRARLEGEYRKNPGFNRRRMGAVNFVISANLPPSTSLHLPGSKKVLFVCVHHQVSWMNAHGLPDEPNQAEKTPGVVLLYRETKDPLVGVFSPKPRCCVLLMRW